MEKYRIKISYRTGNSFGNHEEEDFLDYEWDNMYMAKESLRRIKNHNEYCSEYSEDTKPKTPLLKGVIWDEKSRSIHLELIADNGKPFKCSAFWVGYFETLHCAEIVCEDNDTVYRPN